MAEERELVHLKINNIPVEVPKGTKIIDAARKVLGKDYACTALDVFGLRTGGKRVPIGNEKQAFVLVLHLHETLYCSEIVAQVKISCGPNSAYYFFHLYA